MPQTIKIISDIEKCKILWNIFSPRESIYDLWDFRFPFWEIYKFKPAFVTNDKDGLLPLWYHHKQKQYLWFGDIGDEFNWQENTYVWAKDKSSAISLLSCAPKPLFLTSIVKKDADLLSDKFKFKKENNKSVLNLANMKNTDDYIKTLPKKLRNNMRRDFKKTEALFPQIVWDQPEDLDILFQMNNKRFKDSPFKDEKIRKVFKILLSNTYDKEFIAHTFSLKINGITGAVDCLFEWGKTLYPLLACANTDDFSGIGNAMHLYDIKYALQKNLLQIDFAETETGTAKEKLFQSEEQFSLKLSK